MELPDAVLGQASESFLVKQKTSFIERQQFPPFSVMFEKPI